MYVTITVLIILFTMDALFVFSSLDFDDKELLPIWYGNK